MKNKFYLKLLTACTLIAFAYTLVASVVFYYKNNEILNAELSNRQTNFFKQNGEEIDNKVKVAFKMLNQLEWDSDVLKYIKDTEPNYYTIIQVFEKLRRTQETFLELGYSISISKFEDDLVISPYGTNNVERYLAEIGLPDMDRDDLENYFANAGNTDAHMVVQNKPEPRNSSYKDFLTLAKKEVLSSGEEFYAFLSFDRNTLLPELNDPENEAFLIIGTDEVIMSKMASEDSRIKSLISDELLQTLNNSAKPELKFNKSGYYIQMSNSKALNWKYVYIYSDNGIKNNLKSLLIQSLLLYLILALVGVALAFAITRNLYKPIRNIMELFSNFGQRSSKDELLYIKETATKIKDANEELKNIISNNKLPLKEKFIRDFLTGLLSKTEIDKHLQQYLDFTSNKATCVIMEIVNYNELGSFYSKEDMLAIKSKVLLIIKEDIEQDVACEVLDLQSRSFVIILNEIDISRIKKLLSSTLAKIEEAYKLNIFAAVGRPRESIYEIEKSFNDAEHIIEYGFTLAGRNAVITLEDLDRLKDQCYYYPLDMERELIINIVSGKKNEAHKILKHILDENLKENELSKETISRFIFAVVASVHRILQILNKKADDFYGNSEIIFLELKMYENREQLEEKIVDMFDKIVTGVYCESKELDNITVDKLVRFIHENYNRDIALQDIAGYFNLTTNYVGILFKNIIGEHFRDYLNNYRVKKAKEILERNKNIKIMDLAEMVGCNNVTTFIRIFNKYEGISPGQYLKNRG